MTASTSPARFMTNNFLCAETLYRVTSAASGYASSNLYEPTRSIPWRASGHFEITTTNGTFYFNDGSARTAVVPTGSYTQSSLATAIAAAAVAAGASATVVASAYSTAPYVWQLVFNTSVTLTLSSTTNAIWDVLGFTGSTARTGTTFVADAPRAHTYEMIEFSFGSPMTPTFFAAINALDEVCPASDGAVWTLMLNNVRNWSAPPVSQTLTRSDRGFFEFIDSLASTTYEYAALKIVDRENVLGSAGIEIGHLYLGDHVGPTDSNIGLGWNEVEIDPSQIQRSLNGTRYSNLLPQYRRFSGFSMGLLTGDDRRELKDILSTVGLAGSCFLSIDPMLAYSETLAETTLYGHLVNDASLTQRIRDRRDLSFDFEETV